MAAVMGAAMVTNISPMITFAETAADNGAVAAVEEAAYPTDNAQEKSERKRINRDKMRKAAYQGLDNRLWYALFIFKV